MKVPVFRFGVQAFFYAHHFLFLCPFLVQNKNIDNAHNAP